MYFIREAYEHHRNVELQNYISIGKYACRSVHLSMLKVEKKDASISRQIVTDIASLLRAGNSPIGTNLNRIPGRGSTASPSIIGARTPSGETVIASDPDLSSAKWKVSDDLSHRAQ